jgi:histidinol-phosphate aminotransferase
MSAKNRQLSLDIPDYLQALVPYPPGKPLEELEREYGIKKAIKLASNENPLGPSPKALAVLGNALRSLHRYPDGSAYYLKARLAQTLGITSGEIVLGNGSNEIIDLLVRVFVRPGLEVVSSQPSFLVYQKMVQSVGGRNVVVPLAENRHDLRSIAKNVNQLTRLIFLDNPNNPTGSVIDRTAFDSFLEELPDHILVVLDEAYMEFTRTGETPRGADYMGRDGRVVTLRTFSKAYGLAGLRVGYGLMDKEIAGYVERVRQPFNVNTMAQLAALAALDDDEHLKRTLDVTWKGIDFLTKKLHELGCVVLPSQTNFVLVDVGHDAKRIYEAMLRLGVIVRAMNSYGFPKHIRITAGLQEENDRCIHALERVLSS